MANCDNIVFWSPVPAGSIFKIKATGDVNVFDITVGRSRNGGDETPLGHKQVVPGPASQSVAKGDRWTFTVVMTLFNKPKSPVSLKAWLEDGSSAKVHLPDATGAPTDLHCEWEFTTPGASLIKIFVAA